MFDEQKFLKYISGENLKDSAESLYYDFFESLKSFDSAVREEDAEFSSWDSSELKSFEEQLYIDLKGAFHQKTKYKCEFHFYYGMSLYPHTPSVHVESHSPIKDNILKKIPEYEALSSAVDRAIKQAKKAPGTDKKYITEWIVRYTRRSDVYAKAFLSAGYYAVKSSAETISQIQNFLKESPN